MSDKQNKFQRVAEIDSEHYFGKGKGSLLKREADINMLLLQLTTIVNELSSFHNVLVESSIGTNMERLKEIREKK